MVSPNTSFDKKGEPYFRVLMKTDKNYLGNDPDLYKITPGMQAIVDIHTGEKSVIEYLIMPVLKLKHEAFRER
jgi:adhesin transport system membrane fusion protein